MRPSARLIVGRLALLVFVASLVAPNFANRHVLTEIDADCGAFPTADHARPAFEPIKASATSHCAICHWLRSLRETAPPSASRPVTPFVTAERVATGILDPAGHCPELAQPTRAPPSAASVS